MQHFVLAEDDEEDVSLYEEAIAATKLPIVLTTVVYCDDIFASLTDTPFPNLVIVDGNLPDKSLLECIAAVRAHKNLSKNPLVVLSGSTLKSEEGRSYLAGINLFLEKPANFNEIVEIFRRLYHVNWFNYPILTAERFFAIDI